jgi:predicted GNAT superfamily acetyltransferase
MALAEPESFGFIPIDGDETPEGAQAAWTKDLAAGRIVFRLLRTMAQLGPAEAIQREVFGADDIDIAGATQLVILHETGGDVIGALRERDGEEELVGLSIGWGGYHHRVPVLVSDMLAVREEVRHAGIGFELKKLQAILAANRGFKQVVWTVDPLRAANARLNFEKLGAVCNRYEENVYGESYGTGLYGGLPADRLHMTWRLDDAALPDRFHGMTRPRGKSALLGALPFDPLVPNVDAAYVLIPPDIDALVKSDPEAALAWRMELRRLLPAAFDAGLWLTGFIADADEETGAAALLLTRP